MVREVGQLLQASVGRAPGVVAVLTKPDLLDPPGEWPLQAGGDKAALITETLDYMAREVLAAPGLQPVDPRLPAKGCRLLGEQAVKCLIPVGMRRREEPWNIETLSKEVGKVLPDEAQLEFFQAQRRSELLRGKAQSLVLSFAVIGGTVGSCPIPVSDILILAPLQMLMIALVGGLSCRQFSMQTAAEFLTASGATLGAGYGLRVAAQQLVKLVPFAGDVISGIIAGAGTYAIGKSAELYFFSGVLRPPSQLAGEWKGEGYEAQRSAEAPLPVTGTQVLAPPTQRLPYNEPDLPRELVNSIGMKFVLVPPGKFIMGSVTFADEQPEHEVEITRPFYLGVYPVTQEEYKRVTRANPSRFSSGPGGAGIVRGLDTGRFPVEGVSWDDAVKFCRQLTDLADEKNYGHLYRLPTEAEWEYACRAGDPSSMPFHYGVSLSSTQANFDGNHPCGGATKGVFLERTTAVGSYPPNGFGLYDMHGNVFEWCADWYAEYPQGPVKDPQGPETGGSRLLRGGCWQSRGQNCRATFRNCASPGDRRDKYGFRVILAASAATR